MLVNNNPSYLSLPGTGQSFNGARIVSDQNKLNYEDGHHHDNKQTPVKNRVNSKPITVITELVDEESNDPQ